MSNNKAAEVLNTIRKQFSLKNENINELRRDFEEFYLKFSSNQVLEIENYCINHIHFYKITSQHTKPEYAILFFHGGGFNMGSTKGHLDLCGKLSASSGVSVYSCDYRLAPEHAFPAAVDDCFDSYKWLLKQGLQPENIILAGISAGGTLALSNLLSIKNNGLELPSAVVCMSPAVDMLFQGDSIKTNAQNDWISKERLERVKKLYLQGQDPKNPLASPIYADLEGLPPILLQAGTHEILLDDILSFKDKAIASGVDVTLEKWPGMFHCWQIFSSRLMEGQKAIESAGDYIKKNLFK
ncbi:MAG: alpha/beta hydrolase [Methanomicrobiales archaeon]